MGYSPGCNPDDSGAGAQPRGFEDGKGFKAVAIELLQVGEIQQDQDIESLFVSKE
ncbi:MAG: hypothetical protein RMJ46_08960 [Bacteroidota bacterium]|nr:hypothetical protein [Bacteroidota bacterium]